MNIDHDIIERCKVIGIFFLQFYKVMTGTLLTLFVPQACYTESLTDGSNSETIQICSLTQNFNNHEIYHQITLYWNIFTFILFIISYLFELRREHWAIKFLDINNDIPDNALKDKIIQEPKLDKEMDKLNKFYYRVLLSTTFAYGINILLMIRILIKDYHSISTISCFTSFVLLVIMKLYNSLSVAYKSVHYDKMMSAFMSEFVSYNVLDSDYIENKIKIQGQKKENIEIIPQI
tara:strand:- start:145 stop:846 length:702 start_codon:yes stop_codon:yes gene_type:complete